MASLEGIVRPFTDIGTEPQKGVASLPLPSTNVTLIVTGGGAAITGSYSFSSSFSRYADAKEVEQTDNGS